MYRTRLTPILISASLLLVNSAFGDDQPALEQVQALNQVLLKARQRAEPAIACILVSRGEETRRAAEQPTPPEIPVRPGGLPQRRGFGRQPGRLPQAEASLPLPLDHPDRVPESYGSGVVIDERGLILTNYHVVRDATKIFVRLPGEKASYADIHAADPRSDLAVLKVLDEKILPLAAIKMGDGGAVEKGQWVLSLANPFAAGFRDGSPSVSWGIISNLRRRVPPVPRDPVSEREEDRNKTLHHYGTMIQTDARLNLGVSGGALISLKGELIGLTTALAALSGSETAGGFAVPLDSGMRRIVEVLRRGEEVEYGFLGIKLLPAARRSKSGVQINEATPGSPAYAAGLQPHDEIVAINGMPVHENDDLFLALGVLLAGSEARLEVRSAKSPTRTVTATLAKFYVPGKIIASKKSPAPRGVRVDYTSVLTMQNPTNLGLSRGNSVQPGVFVREVLPKSPAAAIPLREGEVITHVNNQPVNTPAEFYREVAKVRSTEPVELTLVPSDLAKPPPKVTLH